MCLSTTIYTLFASVTAYLFVYFSGDKLASKSLLNPRATRARCLHHICMVVTKEPTQDSVPLGVTVIFQSGLISPKVATGRIWLYDCSVSNECKDWASNYLSGIASIVIRMMKNRRNALSVSS